MQRFTQHHLSAITLDPALKPVPIRAARLSGIITPMPDRIAPAIKFELGESFARAMDAADPLAPYRELFCIPRRPDGQPVHYFAGNSLGLQPRSAFHRVREEMESWAERGVDGHFEGLRPWYSYHEMFRETGARLVGGRPGEVVIMNSLTVNLHLMMVSFYRPTATRHKILIEDPCFPSDIYAVKTQLRCHGIDPHDGLIVIRPRPGEHLIPMDDIEAALDSEGQRIALVMLAGVNFVTGQLIDMPRAVAAGHRHGCMVGFDLAHAAGNVPLSLHDWDADFAVWCNYKYLNSGPGAVGGCFVHERHGRDLALPRFGGWWGNDPQTRFKMQLIPDFVPRPGADGWQVSNPPIFSMAPVKASYDIFDQVGMAALRAKSEQLTGYLEFLLDNLHAVAPDGAADSRAGGPSRSSRGERLTGRLEIITPRDPAHRGCQLSLRFGEDARGVLDALHDQGIVCDFREPDVIRVAPVPLYNTFYDVWRLAKALASIQSGAIS
jgi:kynureninase